MLYHASQTPNIKILEPRVSNHGKPLVYLSQKRENVLVYLSNAVEKHCRENGFTHDGVYTKWGSYGFNGEGVLVLDEYYPNASRETYEGVSGYIYSVSETGKIMEDIPFAFVSDKPVKTLECEFVADAYTALLQAAEQGKIIMNSYESNSPQKLDWIYKTVCEEYVNLYSTAEYKYFLKCKFGL
ncbi:MAG: hypothetical protein K2N26_01145 [Oscillospiraceae bacterium]|nr:hypothetical protein [Oscillospiraceae bacterium]MDE7278320.1 hypothetical protein [Oscillospiraceae bacterium]